jgi:hypothetical protein
MSETVMTSSPAARHGSVSDGDPSPSSSAFAALSMAIAGADAAVNDSIMFTDGSSQAIGSMTSPLSAMQVVSAAAQRVLANGRLRRQHWVVRVVGFE